MYKSQLQEYAQKAGLMHPTYDHVKEGASHEPRFKSTVLVNNQSYESPPGFPTLRSAEHAAAKVALDTLQKTQTTKGVVPSPVHESGLCKNLLQEFAQKNGYPLPQYKIMRQGEEHLLVFTATVEIAGVSYSGGGGKSKKEAEIKAARTALLAIQASQPGIGLPTVEPRPLAQPLPGQIANFVTSHPKRKKRGRAPPTLLEEPNTTRAKQCFEPVGEPLQFQQMHQVHPMPAMHPMPHMMHVPQMNQLPQPYPANTVGYPGQVEWNQELGVASRPTAVYSESYMPQDTTMTEPAWGPLAPHGTEPPLDTPLTTTSAHTETTVVATAKTELAAVQQEDHTVSLVTTEVKETITVTESHVSSVSTSGVVSVQPEMSAPVVLKEMSPVSVAPQQPPTSTNGGLQADVSRPLDSGAP